MRLKLKRLHPDAQAELAEVVRVDFQFVDELSSTDRGTGGFGSSTD